MKKITYDSEFVHAWKTKAGYIYLEYIAEIDNANFLTAVANATSAIVALDPEKCYNRISNFSATNSDIDFNNLDISADMMEEFNCAYAAHLKFAIVAPKLLQFSTGRSFYSMENSKQESQVFHTLEEAQAWLAGAD